MKALRHTIRTLLLVLLATSFLLCIATAAGAATTIYVDSKNRSGIEDGTARHPYTTINKGLAAAMENDMVYVKPGRYRENIDFLNMGGHDMSSGVTLKGAGARRTSIIGNIDCSGRDFSIQGFTIIGDFVHLGSGRGNITIAYNKIKGNVHLPWYGTHAVHHNDVRGGIFFGACDGKIAHNKVYDGFGILHGTDSGMEVTDNEVYRCSVGIEVGNWADRIHNNNLHHNEIGMKIGGYYSDTFTITNNRIWSNRKGGVDIRGMIESKVHLINNLIANNGGPGIQLYEDRGTEASLINNTIIGNKNGIVMTPASEPSYYETKATIANSILWNNGDDLVNTTATYSNIEDGDAGEGNISANPMLNKAYIPTSNSPVIDKGSNALVPANIVTCLYGNPRIADGDGNGQATVDMGACEFVK